MHASPLVLLLLIAPRRLWTVRRIPRAILRARQWSSTVRSSRWGRGTESDLGEVAGISSEHPSHPASIPTLRRCPHRFVIVTSSSTLRLVPSHTFPHLNSCLNSSPGGWDVPARFKTRRPPVRRCPHFDSAVPRHPLTDRAELADTCRPLHHRFSHLLVRSGSHVRS